MSTDATNNEKPEKPTNGQPNAKPPMKTSGVATKMVSKAGDSFADETGKNVADDLNNYESANAQQQIDDAKAQVEGMWAKFCGCFSGA